MFGFWAAARSSQAAVRKEWGIVWQVTVARTCGDAKTAYCKGMSLCLQAALDIVPQPSATALFQPEGINAKPHAEFFLSPYLTRGWGSEDIDLNTCQQLAHFLHNRQGEFPPSSSFTYRLLRPAVERRRRPEFFMLSPDDPAAESWPISLQHYQKDSSPRF